jgi:hypothetical protein
MKIALVPLGIAALTLLLSSCGDSSSSGSAQDFAPVRPFDVVKLSTGGDDSDETTVVVAGARVLADGSVQALVEGESCLRPGRLHVEQGEKTVSIIVFAFDVSGGGACTAQIVPWFIPLHLSAPLGERTITDAKSHKQVRVADCGVSPSDPWCRYPS